MNIKKIIILSIFLYLFFYPFNGYIFADVIGQTVIFNIDPQYDYFNHEKVSATLRNISKNAYWYVSDEYWNELSSYDRNLFSSKLDDLAKEFDNRIYPIETQFWGSEPNPGVDNDSRITILLTKLIDQAGGYFDTSNGYKRTEIPKSNEREMLYINSYSVISDRAKIFLAHEFQHLITFYQKNILNKVEDDIWLNEARSEYSVKLLGYDDNFDNSNLKRRLKVFIQNPSDPLGEWKNEAPDYGSITIFIYYLADHYGENILKESLRSQKIGIDSINEALEANGFSEKFSDIFVNWAIANFLNDNSVGQKFSYLHPELKNLRVSSTQNYNISGANTLISISNFIKDWQPFWYEFNFPINFNQNLKMEFNKNPDSKIEVASILFNIDGTKKINYLKMENDKESIIIKDLGSKIYKLVLIPISQVKSTDFTNNEPSFYFNFLIQPIADTSLIYSSTPLPTPSVTLTPSPTPIPPKNEIMQPMVLELKRNLFIGSRGIDVEKLQEFLINQNVYPEKLITGYFGPLTKKAVINFQKKYNIRPAIGFVGPITRAKIRDLTK